MLSEYRTVLMKLIALGGLFFVFFINQIIAQQGYNHIIIRDYKYSFVLSIDNNVLSDRYWYSDYGGFVTSVGVKYRFLYQGQEFIPELGIYLFPYRTYQSKNMHFQQPDPKLQYFSPYLFVGADPINRVDLDGQESKLLFVYEDFHHGEGQEFKQALENFQHTFGDDAYYVPMSDFMMGKVGELPDWNGNTYILSHMGVVDGKPIIDAENGKTFGDLKLKSTRNIPVKKFHAKGDYFVSRIRPKDFGIQLKKTAEANRVTINNVMAGGCQSNAVAAEIRNGIQGKTNTMQASRRFRVFGLYDSYQAQTMGVVEGLEEQHEYFIPKGLRVGFDTENAIKGITPPVRMFNGNKPIGEAFEITGADQIRALANGEIPRSASSFFAMHPGWY